VTLPEWRRQLSLLCCRDRQCGPAQFSGDGREHDRRCTASRGFFYGESASLEAGTSITLTDSNPSSPNAGGAITGVTFYQEANSTTGLQINGSNSDLLVGQAYRDLQGIGI